MAEQQQWTPKVGDRVYCPTFGHYGIIVGMGITKASISLIGAYGIGTVEIEHGKYEKPMYVEEVGYNKALYEHYEQYCQEAWGFGVLALPYRSWLEAQAAADPATELARTRAALDALNDALKPFASMYKAYQDYAEVYGDKYESAFWEWFVPRSSASHMRMVFEAAADALAQAAALGEAGEND